MFQQFHWETSRFLLSGFILFRLGSFACGETFGIDKLKADDLSRKNIHKKNSTRVLLIYFECIADHNAQATVKDLQLRCF